MLVHHYVPFSSNVGDLFVRDGIHQRMREVFPNVRIVELPANDPHRRSGVTVGLQGANLECTNAEADLVIVGGSNMYDGSDWRFKTSVDAIKELMPPLAFIGLGVGSIRGDKAHLLSERSRQEIQVSHRKAIAVAVRDVDTVDFLAGLGINSTLIGCPATFIGQQPLKPAAPQRVLVSAPPERFMPKLGHKGYLAGKIMETAFKQVLSTLKASGTSFDVVAHDGQDMPYLPQFLEPFGKKPLYYGMETMSYLDLFRAADLVVCYRLHMAITCHGLGVPFLLVNFDKRTAAFRNTFEAQDVTFDAFGLRDQRRLSATVRALVNPNAVLQAAWGRAARRRDDLREVTQKFYAELATMVPSYR